MPRTTQRLPQPLEPDSLFNFVSSVRDKSVPESPPAPTASAFQLWHVGGPEPAFQQHTLPKVNADGSVMLMYRQCGVEGCIAAEGHKTDITERSNGSRLLREECPLRLTAEELLDHAIRSVAVYHNLCVKNPACVHGYHSRVQNTYLLNGKPKNRLFFNVAVGRWVRELRPVVQSSSEKKHFPRCHLRCWWRAHRSQRLHSHRGVAILTKLVTEVAVTSSERGNGGKLCLGTEQSG